MKNKAKAFSFSLASLNSAHKDGDKGPGSYVYLHPISVQIRPINTEHLLSLPGETDHKCNVVVIELCQKARCH